MAALTLGNIPSHINTYERLLMWAAQCCQSIGNGVEVNPVSGAGSVPVCQVQIAKISDGTDRAVVVAYLPIIYDDLNSSTEKTWMAASAISNANPHANLLQN